MKQLLFALFLLVSVTAFGQLKPLSVNPAPAFKWVVADFDSAAELWSPAFSFEGFTASTFDAQGLINMGTAAAGGTYSTVLLMYGSFDGTNWELCDSLGTVTATTNTKISVDLDDFDQCPLYKILAKNGGADNTFSLGLKSEYVK